MIYKLCPLFLAMGWLSALELPATEHLSPKLNGCPAKTIFRDGPTGLADYRLLPMSKGRHLP